MFKSFLFAAGMLWSFLATGQHSFTGVIRDSKNKQPLGGATIELHELKKFALADAEGRFQLTNLPEGAYQLTIRHVGFTTLTKSVSVPSGQEAEFVLEESAILTDEVIVYATRANDKTPATYSNIDREKIQEQNFGQDLPFLLNWTPSLVTTSDAGTGIGYTGLRIRGSDATRINVTINGIPLNDSESQGTFWVDIPDIASSTESIQIQRGVGTSTNGAGAFGASVNVQTSSIDEKPFGEINTSYGSFNTQRYTVKAGTGLIKDRWGFEGRVSRIKSDGYIDRATSDLASYYFSGGFYGKKTVLKAIAFGGQEETYQAWYGVDGPTMKANRTFNYAGAIYNDNWEIERYYDNEVDHYNQDHFQLHLAQQLNEFWTANAALHFTYGRGYYEQYLQDQSFADYGLENVVLGGETVSASDFIVRKWLDNKFYGTTFSLNYEKDKVEVTVGGAYNEYADAKHFGEIIWAQYASNSSARHRYYKGESQKNDFNIFAKLNYQLLPSLNGYLDLQYRAVDYKTAGTDDGLFAYDVNDHLGFFNPKAGLTYSLGKGDLLYASYAIANREPSRTDYLGNDDKPKHEKLANLEVGYKRNSPRYNAEVNYYLMNYTNQLVLTGQLNDVGTPIRSNVGKSFRSGIEISGTIKVLESLSIGANGTYSVNRNRDFAWYDGDNQLITRNTTIILSPSFIGGSQIAWTPFKGFSTTLLSKFVGKQYLDNTEDEALTIDSYFVNDMRLTYTFNLKSLEKLQLGLLVNNLFDVEYASNGYTWGGAYYYPQAGRNFMGMLSVRF